MGSAGSSAPRWRPRQERHQVGPEVGSTSAFYRCIPTRVHGPTCIFWANLTPFSLQADAEGGGGAAAAGAPDGEPVLLPLLLARELGGQKPKAEGWFADRGLWFNGSAFRSYPFALQQQSAPRWVDDRPGHPGRYSVWQAGATEAWLGLGRIVAL